MSFFSDASLVYVPSGVKDAKTYSIKPTDGSGDLTFSRGSDIEATRIGADGLIHKAQVNLALRSNTFNTTWLNVQSSTSTGFSGYDGSSDAWKAVENTANSNHYAYQNSINTGVSTLSVYAKTNGRDLQLRVDGVGTNKAFVNYDLSAGSIGLSGGTGLIDSNIESVGGGWYRCSFAVNDSGTYGMGIVMITDAATSTELSSYLGDGVSGIFIQDAQVNYGLVAQDYQETTTAAVVSGITDDMPRLDYSGGATCPSLLLEPSRVNLIPYSEYFGASDWAKSGSGVGSAPVITNNATTSPEGLQNASKIDLNLNGGSGSGDWSWIYDNFSATASQQYTTSVWLKAASPSDVGKVVRVGFLSYQDYTLTEDWQRAEVTETATTTTSYSSGIRLRGSESTADSVSFYAYGFQLESGSYPTSYIPTYGSSATRTADACSKTGISSLIGQTEGTIFVEIQKENLSANSRAIAIGDGTGSNRAIIFSNSGNRVRFYFRDSSSIYMDYTYSGVDLVGNMKLALAYKANDLVAYVDGVQIATANTAVIPAMNVVYIGTSEITTSNQELDGGVKQALLFTSRLSNADLETLTSL